MRIYHFEENDTIENALKQLKKENALGYFTVVFTNKARLDTAIKFADTYQFTQNLEDHHVCMKVCDLDKQKFMEFTWGHDEFQLSLRLIDNTPRFSCGPFESPVGAAIKNNHSQLQETYK